MQTNFTSEEPTIRQPVDSITIMKPPRISIMMVVGFVALFFPESPPYLGSGCGCQEKNP
jgi:hypothetical protein